MTTETQEITNTEDIIDSRDIQARIDYLESLEEEDEEATDADEEPMALCDDEREELRLLQEFKDEANTSEWKYGMTFIRDDYFEDYAREFAEDIGAIGKDDQWPATCIDWERAARELQMDYTGADFDGITYWFR